MYRLKLGLACSVLLGLSASRCVAQSNTLASYHIGNSLTVDSNIVSMGDMASQRGKTAVADWHILTGSTLPNIYANPNTTNLGQYFAGPFPQALTNYTWNAITLEPFFSPLDGPDGDKTAILNFMNYAKTANAANGNAQFYIFSRWEQQSAMSGGLTYTQAWNLPYTQPESGDTTTTADYFAQLTTAVRHAQPQDMKPILVIPTGHVFAALDEQIRAGQLPGLTSITDLYRDFIHLAPLGSFIASATFYATIYRDNPIGLTPWSGYPAFDPVLVNKIETTIWNVVSKMPDTGVPRKGDSDLDGDADGVDIGTWAVNFTGELGGTGSKTWAQGDWDYDGDVDGVDAGLWAQAFTGELGGGGLSSITIDSPINPQAAAILQGMGITVIPEPAALSLVLLMAFSAIRSRGRRTNLA
jgi:hypothetical protein